MGYLNGIDDEHNHKVTVYLPVKNIFDSTARQEKFKKIKDWIDELVEWQDNQYSLHVHSSGQIMNIWFRDEHHAMLCTLRWS